MDKTPKKPPTKKARHNTGGKSFQSGRKTLSSNFSQDGQNGDHQEDSRNSPGSRNNTSVTEPLPTIPGSMEQIIIDIYNRLDKLDKLDNIAERLGDLESTFNAVRQDLSCVKTDIDAMKNSSDMLNFNVGELGDRILNLEREREDLRNDIIDMKARSMRDNLLFCNIPEEQSPENTEKVVREFMCSNLKMTKEKVDEIKIERVHRTGPRRFNKPRNIVAKFSYFKDRESVRKEARNLKGSNYFVSEQFPPEIVAQRRELVPLMKRARADGKRAYINYNKLYVDGQEVRPR